jgi:outer membrane protein assembly factor BamB
VKTNLIFCVGLIALMFVENACADDWSGWRGPRGDGISREAIAPLHWSTIENISWKTAVPGTGLSSPIVVGKRVFLTTGDATDESRRVLSFDAESGKLLWNVIVHRGPGGTMHRFNSTASSTPVSDGKYVFASFVDDKGLVLAAVDFDGREVWNRSLGTFHSTHGFAACPVLFGGCVIVNGQQDGDAFVVALRCSDGEESWRYRPDVNLRSFSTPVLTKVGGRDQLILTGSSQTLALDPQSGERIWFAEGPTQKFVCTPCVGHGLVFSFGGSPEKRMMAVRLGGVGDVLGTHLAWRNERSMPYVPSPLLAGDYLHIMNDSGIYTCLAPLTGETLHTGRKLGSVYSSPISVADRIYFFEDSGTCTVIRNNSEFEILAVNELGETVQTTPAFSDGSLFVRTETQLVRISSLPSVR